MRGAVGIIIIIIIIIVIIIIVMITIIILLKALMLGVRRLWASADVGSEAGAAGAGARPAAQRAEGAHRPQGRGAVRTLPAMVPQHR